MSKYMLGSLRLPVCSGQDTLLITGVGPVGMAVGVLAKALGVRKVYGTDASAERLALAKDKVGLLYNSC